MSNATRLLVEPEKSCLLIIDPQEKLMPAIHEADRVIRQSVLMLQCADVLNMQIVATTQYVKGLGPFVHEISELLTDHKIIDKTEFNAFANPDFMQKIESMQINSMIITGVEAHICVYQTAISAMEHGLNTWVVTDAVSSRNRRHSEEAITMMMAAGINAGPAEMIVYQLIGRAGTATFRNILPFIK